MRTKVMLVAGLAAGLLATAAGASAGDGGLSSARAGTAAFHRLAAATAAGYGGPLVDVNGISCIDDPAGGMGVHYVRGDLVGDGEVSAATPEALVYEPQANGRMRLVAVEYVVLKSAWEAKHGAGAPAPSLFGRSFEFVPAGNRYGLPDFYELHAWIWKHNPSGMFEDWNPTVSCAAG